MPSATPPFQAASPAALPATSLAGALPVLLPAARLGVVALPLLARDIGAPLARILALWADPRFRPVVQAATPRPVLLVVVNRAGPDDIARARALWQAHPVLAESFADFRIESAELTGDRDLYARGSDEPQGRYGNKAGPNFLFQRTMELAAPFGGFTLQIELDCLPLGAGWVEAAAAVAQCNTRAWVIGALFAARQGIDSSIQTHLNGNALYHTGDPAFITFLQQVWMPGLLRRSRHMPNLAYDCWWAVEEHQADAWAGNAAWALVQDYASFIRSEPFIINLLAGRDRLHEFVDAYDRYADLGRAPVFFHGQPMTAVAETLLAHRDDSIFDAIARLSPAAEAAPPGLADSEADVPVDGTAAPLVLVLGFHAIEAPDPRHRGGPRVWSAARTVYLALSRPQPQLRLRFHVRADSAPGFSVRDADGDSSLPARLRWDPVSRRGHLTIDTAGLTGPMPLIAISADQGPADQGEAAGLTLPARGQGVLYITDGQPLTHFEALRGTHAARGQNQNQVQTQTPVQPLAAPEPDAPPQLRA